MPPGAVLLLGKLFAPLRFGGVSFIISKERTRDIRKNR